MNDKNNITILNFMLAIKHGGLEQVSYDYADAMIKSGYNVHFACHAKNVHYINLAAKFNNKLHPFIGKSLYNPINYLRVIKCIKKVNPDIIFLHGNRAIDLVANILIRALFPNIKILATTHNYRNKRFNKLDGCLAISKDLVKNLQDIGISKSNIFYVPNTVEYKKYKPYKAHNPVNIGTIGRLHPVKGYDVLLDACKIMVDNKTDFKLIMAGEGEEKDSLIKQAKDLGISDKVDFIGFVKADTKEKFFNDIDINCISSRSEGLSLTFLEGLSYSKPCVLTQCPGLVEVLNGKDTGIVVPTENPKALADALTTYINDEKLAADHAEKSNKIIKDSHSYEVLQDKLKDIISIYAKSK